jgi:hypothetical protein
MDVLLGEMYHGGVAEAVGQTLRRSSIDTDSSMHGNDSSCHDTVAAPVRDGSTLLMYAGLAISDAKEYGSVSVCSAVGSGSGSTTTRTTAGLVSGSQPRSVTDTTAW